MPLIGNPSLAGVLYGPSVTFDVQVLAATQTVAAVASLETEAAVNQTLINEMQKAAQMGMSSTMPRNLYLAFAGLLALCMIISHPRFLARLFASLKSEDRLTSPSSAINPLHAALDSPVTERSVGGGGLRQGWFLRRGENKSNNIQFSHRPLHSPISTKSDPFASPLDEKSRLAFPVAQSTPAPRLYPPPHIVPLLFNLPFSSSLLFTPFSRLPNPFKSYLTVTQLYLVVGYCILISFALIWKSDLSPATKDKGYGGDFMRSGLVSMAQIPLAIALGVRGNIIGLCVGKGYERLKVFHKIVGRLTFLAATVHSVAYIYKWSVAGKFSAYAKKPFAMWGILSYFALVLIVITSLPQVRKTWHGFFEMCHFIGIIGTVLGLALHVPVAVPFCIASLVVYALSIFCSLTKTRFAHAELHALPGAATTVITFPSIQSGWRAGQHVRIRIPALGIRHGLEGHPFTIASAPDGEGLVLMAKNVGDWTARLFTLAQRSSDSEDRAEGGKNNATVIIEGPYGGLGNTLAPSFSSVLLIAGGSGITQALSLAHDLITRAPTGVVRARTIDLVWMVRTEDAAKPIVPTLIELVNEAKQWEVQCLEGRRKGEKKPQPTALRVKIFVTRCPASSPINLLSEDMMYDQSFHAREDPRIRLGNGHLPECISGGIKGLKRQPSAADKEKYAYLCRNPSSASTVSTLTIKHNTPLSTISVNPVRPNFDVLLSSLAEETIARHGRQMTDASGILVTACGPEGMVHAARESVRKLEEYKQRAAGGVEFEDENFGY
ncbi:hypothetical protein I316_05588 [Kwoniella heveanensis BCC8398]|uniref:ferric-chelate reductase (NADPH) n=1 Tax=Kwoniella heveanensis BCC8398 TaxID=1296120 RepID=A0A1B9GNS6_9TREE|nr:hypothetical protein I316_05588 [Kwoniella heveanensis BCC8398]